MSKKNQKTNASISSSLVPKEYAFVAYLFSEGETETRYLQDLAKKHNVKVLPVYCISSPRMILSKARDWAYANRSELDSLHKQVWALFDDDEKVADIQRAVREFNAKPKGYKKNTVVPKINVGYMKPCIELWGAMCITGNAKSLPQMHAQMESKLKQLMKGYDHDSNRYFDVSQMKQTPKAIALAKSWEHNCGPFPACVGHASKFAGIYSLVERILSSPERL